MVRDTSSIFTEMTWGRKFLWNNHLGLKWQKKWSMTLNLSGRGWNKPKIIKRVMQITIGGKVFPKVTLYRHVMRLKRRGKLASTFIYPFEILERISKEILVFYINMNLWNWDFIIEKKTMKVDLICSRAWRMHPRTLVCHMDSKESDHIIEDKSNAQLSTKGMHDMTSATYKILFKDVLSWFWSTFHNSSLSDKVCLSSSRERISRLFNIDFWLWRRSFLVTFL